MKKIVWLIIMVLVSLYSFCQSKQKTPAKPKIEKATAEEPANDQKITAESGKDIIAIYPFTTARGFDYEFAQSVGNAIEAGFVKSNRFTVVERSRFGSLKSEEHFEEVNTSLVVKAATKFGAKYIVTGHITGVSTGELHDYQGKFTGYQTSISVAFKIIDVETGEIKVTENLNLSGTGGSTASSIGSAYSSIDGVTRRVIASYFPQRFPFMAIVTKESKKKEEILTVFKMWGGSDHGLKVGDMVEVYQISEVINPATKKKVSEKEFVAAAQISQINSGTTSTCSVYKPRKYGKPLLDLITSNPESVAIEYTGGTRPKSFFDGL